MCAWGSEISSIGIGHLLGRLGEGLREGRSESKEPAGRSCLAVQVAGIGHQLVDDDQARAELVEQFGQVVGAGADAVCGRLLATMRVALRAAELVGQLAPEGVTRCRRGSWSGLPG